MPGDKTNGYAVDTIESEGLDYAVRHYTSADVFKDLKTRKLWAAAEKSLNDLVEYLKTETGRDFD
jgi:hypothetical protein